MNAVVIGWSLAFVGAAAAGKQIGPLIGVAGMLALPMFLAELVAILTPEDPHHGT